MKGYLYSDGRVCSFDFCRKGYLYSDGKVCSLDFVGKVIYTVMEEFVH